MKFFIILTTVFFAVLSTLGCTSVAQLADTEARPESSFITRIEERDPCGFTRASRVSYLINGSSSAAFTVTVEIVTKFGNQQNTTQRQYYVPAGGTVFLGCGDSDSPPLSYFTYTIVGEVRS